MNRTKYLNEVGGKHITILNVIANSGFKGYLNEVDGKHSRISLFFYIRLRYLNKLKQQNN